MKSFLTILLFSLTFVCYAQRKPIPAAALPLEQRLSDFDAFVNQVLKDWNTPGCGVAVVHKNKIIWAKGYGYRDLEKKLPVTPNTLFKIASNTKLFTATAIGMLVEEGKLEWDKPIRQFVPSLQFYNDELNRSVTIRDMLAHRTGISRHDMIWVASDLTTSQLTDRVRFLEPSLPLRQGFLYNNMMYEAAGSVIEQLSGQSWQSFMQQRLLDPLGMHQTLIDYERMDAQTDMMRSYYEKRDTTLLASWNDDLKEVGPAGSVLTSLNEGSQWLIAQMNGGKINGKQVIPGAIIQETMTPTTAVKNELLTRSFTELLTPVYGMGRYMAAYRGHYITYHGGAIDAQYSQISFMPYDSLGVITFVNSAHGRPINNILTYGAFDRLLGLPPTDWHNRFLSTYLKDKKTAREARQKASSDRITNTKPSHPLADYAGIFTHPAYGTVRITEQKDQLNLYFHRIKLPLQHYHYDRFQTPDDERYGQFMVIYETNAQGDLDKVRIPLDQQEVTFTRQPDTRLTDLAFLKKLTGGYQLNDTKAQVVLKDGKLQILFAGQPPYDLEPYRNNSFRLKQFSDTTLEFILPVADNLTGLKVKDGTGETTWQRLVN